MTVNTHPNAQPTAAELTISHGKWSARIATSGAALVHLSAGDTQIVSSDWLNSADWFAGSTLAPWVNRLDAGAWHHERRTLRAHINDKDNNCANHGLVFDRVFQVVQMSDSQLELSTVIHDDAAYPFEVRLTVFYELTEFGLRSVISAENIGDSTAPFAAGTHPYFVTDPASELVLEAHEEFEVDGRMLPIGRKVATTPASESRVIRVNDPEDYTDTCFAGLTRYAEGFAQSTITRPLSNERVTVFQSQDFSYLQVFTLLGTDFAGDNTLLALEAQSAPANAFNTGDGLVWLEPGQIWSGTWGIDIEEVAE